MSFIGEVHEQYSPAIRLAKHTHTHTYSLSLQFIFLTSRVYSTTHTHCSVQLVFIKQRQYYINADKTTYYYVHIEHITVYNCYGLLCNVKDYGKFLFSDLDSTLAKNHVI